MKVRKDGILEIRRVHGIETHDAVASANPLLLGGFAQADPDSLTDVGADDDLTQLAATRAGLLYATGLPLKKEFESELDTLEATYDGTPANNNSSDIDVTYYREGTISFTLVSSGSPTDFRIILQYKNVSDTTYHAYREGIWPRLVYSDAAVASSQTICLPFRCPASIIRFRVVATGVSVGNDFTFSNCVVQVTT